MKRFLTFFLTIFILADLGAQPIQIVSQGVGNTFSPANITVNQGDIIRFTLSSSHPVAQVSQATWDANGGTLLPGGFSFPSGSGDYTTSTPGTIYYVCTEHVGTDAMKGTVVVNAVTGINDFQKDTKIKVYPNPASEYVTYQTKPNSVIQEVRILDITGRSVIILQKPIFSGDQVRIDLGSLNKGIYFIQVRSENGIKSGKFLKS